MATPSTEGALKEDMAISMLQFLLSLIEQSMIQPGHNNFQQKRPKQFFLQFSDVEERPRSSNTHLTRNSIPRNSGGSSKRPEAGVTEARSRPAPAALQEVVDRPVIGQHKKYSPLIGQEVVDRPSVGRGQRPREQVTGNKASDWSIQEILAFDWSNLILHIFYHFLVFDWTT